MLDEWFLLRLLQKRIRPMTRREAAYFPYYILIAGSVLATFVALYLTFCF